MGKPDGGRWGGTWGRVLHVEEAVKVQLLSSPGLVCSGELSPCGIPMERHL